VTRASRKTPLKDDASTPALGTKVRVHLGSHVFEAEVVEDRGDIGAGGRRLLRVAVKVDTTVIEEYELPADQVEPL
jgi:hypothetical protein